MTLPTKWTNKTLRDLATINYGRDPSAILDDAGEYPVYGTSGSERQGTGYHYEGESIILGRKGSIDRLHFAEGRFWTIDTAYFLSDFDDTVPKWLYYLLCSVDLRALNEATGVPSLSRDLLYKISTPTPPPDEQAKIAEVLSTVDRAIEQTEALIAKQQRIKTGLLQDLLTRGIDEHGNLRSEQTHKFKESPLGRIPVEWECKELSQVLVQRPRNGLYKPASLIGRGTLLVGQTSFTQDRRLDFSLCRRAVVSPSEIETFGLVFGDILVTRVFATVDGVGQPVLVDSPPEPAVYESNMLLLRPDASIIDSLLLFTWLRSAATRRRVLCSVNASNQVSVNQTVLNSLPVPVPSISEQKRISQALGQIDAAVRCTDVSLQKLRLLKTGLMQDLLTGERRVTALLGSPKELVDA